MSLRFLMMLLFFVIVQTADGADAFPAAFFQAHCTDCHDADMHSGNLDLTALKPEFSNPEIFGRWVKVLDRVQSGEMPPKKKARPPVEEQKAVTRWLNQALSAADVARQDGEGRTILRRMTRAEYENTIRDLFDLPGIALQNGLPADGMAHGFDKNSDALDISHVNMAKYMEAADLALDMAIATQPNPPTVYKARIYLSHHIAHILGNGDAVLLKDKQPDPEYLPSGDQRHIDEGAHERMGSFDHGSSVGVFRHEDESFNPYFQSFAAVYPGTYHIRASFWSFRWDKGKVLPSRGVEAARLSTVQFNENGRGGGHPSRVLGYYDAPSIDSKVHEFDTWFNYKESLGFNTASLAPTANYARKGRAMTFTGPGIACDWLDVEGPIHKSWPPNSHNLLFGDLPITEFKPAEHKDVHPPLRPVLRQEVLGPKNKPDVTKGIWTVQSDQPLIDADKLFEKFLPKAFRRPVDAAIRKRYVAHVETRLKAGDTFEAAMRWAYRAALCSPAFLYRVEPLGKLDDYALASRLSYFLWNSSPDEELFNLAAAGKLHDAATLDGQVERLLKDAKSQRFIEDFLGQWLKLRQIASNDPDRKLYPEFSPYLQDSMLAESRAYFRELLKNLDASYLVRSNFAMLNEKLAVHYGIKGVSGSQIRRVDLPAGCPRGGFLTQAAILKVTANGTTTSPVVRGAFVMGRILGQPPEPPPPNIPAVEPDVRGTKTIREQLDKHRNDSTCASCHAKIDPPGFAMESFDVIGGFRERYRSIGDGDIPPRGSIDPIIGISFKLGPKVDASGVLADERKFGGIEEFKAMLAADSPRLLKNLAQQLTIYAAGREIAFSDREALADLVDRTQKKGGGIRTLIHELVQCSLFKPNEDDH